MPSSDQACEEILAQGRGRLRFVERWTGLGVVICGSNLPRPCESCDLEVEAQRELQIALALTRAAATFGEYFPKGRGVSGVKPDVGCSPAAAIAAPIRVVPNVVRLGPELESYALCNREGLEQAEVPVLEPGLVDDVADARVIERPSRGLDKDLRAVGVSCGEPLTSWAKR